MMDTDKCRMLLRSVETGSLTSAARELGLTTSGVGRSIEALERQTGFPIIKRTSRGVSLTREGRELLPLIKDFIRLEDSYLQQAAEIKGLQIGSVVVGTAYTNFYPWLSQIIYAFHDAFPAISVQIMEGTSSELAHLIAEHELDFGLGSARPGKHRWIPLAKDELVAVLPADHAHADAARIEPHVFSEEPFIQLHPGRETDNSLLFKSLGIEPSVRFATDDSMAALAMVRAGLGISLVNKLLARQLPSNIVSISLDPPCYIDCGIMAPPAAESSPAAQRFFDFALKSTDSLASGS